MRHLQRVVRALPRGLHFGVQAAPDAWHQVVGQVGCYQRQPQVGQVQADLACRHHAVPIEVQAGGLEVRHARTCQRQRSLELGSMGRVHRPGQIAHFQRGVGHHQFCRRLRAFITPVQLALLQQQTRQLQVPATGAGSRVRRCRCASNCRRRLAACGWRRGGAQQFRNIEHAGAAACELQLRLGQRKRLQPDVLAQRLDVAQHGTHGAHLEQIRTLPVGQANFG